MGYDYQSLAARDQSQDKPCRFCGKPLWRIHQDGPFELQWGHVTRTDAYYCTESRRPGVWPTPDRNST